MTRFREAAAEDVPAIVSLLHDDALGSGREAPGDPLYAAAFAALRGSGTRCIVGEAEGEIVACYELILIESLTLKATRRAQIEGVRIAGHLRGQGLGTRLIADAEARARAAGAGLLQLTMNLARTETRRFYERHGFEATHAGYKKALGG